MRLDVAEAVAESYRAVFLNSVLPGGVLGDVDRARRPGREAGDATLDIALRRVSIGRRELVDARRWLAGE